ncbi:MAG: hypothetical protein RMJ14_03260 [Nitrososphaerota archaeon]|nr:hypothetical protein [Aigarchaeota archaeon]MDW8076639.1 hypothetical protein [Nitrososphaerota archaeon]
MLHSDLIAILIAFIVTTSALIVVYVMQVYKAKRKVEETPAPNPDTVKIEFPEVKLKDAEGLRTAILEFKGKKNSEVEELFEKLNTAKESIKKLMEELESANHQ